MSAFKVWVTKSSDGQFVFLPGLHYGFNNGDAPESNPIHKHFSNIKNAIADVDPKTLESLLNFRLQCSAVLDISNESDGLGLEDDQEDDDAYKTTNYQVTVRPFVEGLLFLNNFKELQEIVTLILKTENVQLYRAFAASLPTDSLSEERLFGWSQDLSQKVRDNLRYLMNYGQKLCLEGIDKGRAAMHLGIELMNDVNRLEGKMLIPTLPPGAETTVYAHYRTQDTQTREISQQPSQGSTASRTYSTTQGSTLTTPGEGVTIDVPLDEPAIALDVKPTFQKNLRVLEFKLGFCQKLHTRDAILNEHRHASKIIANLLSIFLTGMVANVVNYMVTGNFLFFNKTTTATMVNQIDNEVRPHTLVMAY
jgi:hypothetical protein